MDNIKNDTAETYLERKLFISALRVMADVRFRTNPEWARQTVEALLDAPVPQIERELFPAEDLPQNATRRDLLERLPDVETDAPPLGSDDSIVAGLCDIIDALRQDNERLRDQLSEREAKI